MNARRPSPAKRSRADDGDPVLPPVPARRRVLVLGLAVATALTIAWALIYRPGDPKRDLPRTPRPAAAASGVGDKAMVTLVPASRPLRQTGR